MPTREELLRGIVTVNRDEVKDNEAKMREAAEAVRSEAMVGGTEAREDFLSQWDGGSRVADSADIPDDETSLEELLKSQAAKLRDKLERLESQEAHFSSELSRVRNALRVRRREIERVERMCNELEREREETESREETPEEHSG